MIGAPLAQALLSIYTWQNVFIIFAFSIIIVMAMVPLLKGKPVSTKKEIEVSLTKVLTNAFKDPNFGMIFLGFFACGYQLAFVSAHFPAMITEMCSAVSPTSMLNYLGISNTSSLGALAIALIGFSNIFGTNISWMAWSKVSKEIFIN